MVDVSQAKVPNENQTNVLVLSPKETTQQAVNQNITGGVSAFSIAGFKTKQAQAQLIKETQETQVEYLREPFTETDLKLYWSKYAQKMSDSGQKLIETYMKMNELVLNGTTITLELPNESSKKDFDSQKHDILNYLRGKLHNHDISIEILVNEEVENKYIYTVEEKYDYLKSINPSLELLKKTFHLEL